MQSFPSLVERSPPRTVSSCTDRQFDLGKGTRDIVHGLRRKAQLSRNLRKRKNASDSTRSRRWISGQRFGDESVLPAGKLQAGDDVGHTGVQHFLKLHGFQKLCRCHHVAHMDLIVPDAALLCHLDRLFSGDCP